MKFCKKKWICIFTACFLLFTGFACSSTDSYVGTYTAFDTAGKKHRETVIELKENGEGSWTCCDAEVQFSWYIKGNKLRINTKEGGIMVGSLQQNAFTITLPGNKNLMFKRTASAE